MKTTNQILSIGFDLLDYKQTFETVCKWKKSGRREIVTLTNPHSVLLCQRDYEMKKATEMAGMTLPDGTGIIWAANILGYKNSGRVTGPKLLIQFCDWGRKKGLRHFFMGGAEGVADKLVENLSTKYPGLKVAGTFCPPFRQLSEKEDSEILTVINQTRSDIIWVGLGAPKQEKWMAKHLGKINATAIIGIGAAFDFHSGNVKWAPALIRKCGFEWAWRLVLNPKRMWQRNLDSPIFLLKVIWQRLTTAMNNNRHIATGNQLKTNTKDARREQH